MKTTTKGMKRKALSEVQPTASKQCGLAVTDGVMRLNLVKNQKRLTFDDPENSAPPKPGKTDCDAALETPCDAYDLMVNEPVPAEYWRQLAEQRRIALEKALEENEQLQDQVDLLTAENKHLQTLADQALPLAELLKELTGGTEPSLAE
ncbi:geminin DNA replication inhibitor [Amblyomma americanum]